MKSYTKRDVDKRALSRARVAIIGYGSQGRAHALNLRDSGHRVVVGNRKGESWKRAKRDGFAVMEPKEAVAGAALIAMLAPDTSQREIYYEIEPGIRVGATLLFAHGFNIRYGQIRPRRDLDVVLIAPKGPGELVRRQYEHGRGVPCLIAVAQDATGKAKARALAYADAIGGTRAGVLATTFAEETETDLFGEQTVICGGVTELVLKGFDVLVEAGYQPEVAYYECLHELKLIVDLLHEGGLAKMHKYISHTAKWGDLTVGPRIVGNNTEREMRRVLNEIKDGRFARRWIRENKVGRPTYEALLKKDLSHPIEKVGAKLRARMPWLEDDR